MTYPALTTILVCHYCWYSPLAEMVVDLRAVLQLYGFRNPSSRSVDAGLPIVNLWARSPRRARAWFLTLDYTEVLEAARIK